jgi:hypothetical protein
VGFGFSGRVSDSSVVSSRVGEIRLSGENLKLEGQGLVFVEVGECTQVLTERGVEICISGKRSGKLER